MIVRLWSGGQVRVRERSNLNSFLPRYKSLTLVDSKLVETYMKYIPMI